MSLSVDIEKRLGNFKLKVNFETENETLALFGASGCGKSMTLRCIAGIEKPDRGRIVLGDKVLFDSEKRINLSPQKRHVGYLFQQYALFPNMTVEQNIACGIHKHKDPEKIAEMIKTMHLEGMEKKRPDQLSGGQQQRTALARILIGDPDILMLDEPFSALDTHLRYEMELEVRQVIKRFGKPVILVSHDRDEVYRISDRIAVMKNGAIEFMNDKVSVFMNPQTINGAILTGYDNISRIKVLGPGRVYAIDWQCELDVDGDTQGITHIGARTKSFEIGGDENAFQCKVTEIVNNAFSNIVHAAPENAVQGKSFAIHASENIKDIKVADTITVSLPKDRIALIRED